jgi:hypothetical protein
MTKIQFLRLRAVFRYAQKTPFNEIYWGDVVFFLQTKNFSAKKQHHPLAP